MSIGRSYGPDGAGAPPERRPSDDGQGRAEARDGGHRAAAEGPEGPAGRAAVVVIGRRGGGGHPTSTASVADTARGTGAPRPAARRRVPLGRAVGSGRPSPGRTG